MKLAKHNISLLAAIGVVGALVGLLTHSLQTFVSKALADSESIRVAEIKSCISSNAEEPHFNGCSSIL